MSSITENEIKKGQAVYTPFILRLYNLWVLDISNSYIWRCPKAPQLQQFNELVTANHLDIGVGTGYYLKNTKWPADAKIALMDLNPNCLAMTKNALAEYSPITYQADIFKPQPELNEQFDSISMNYLLHCLPGDMSFKSAAIENAVKMLKPGGTLFGATILANPELHNKISTALCGLYNRKGIFSNAMDTLQALEKALATSLTDVEITVVGCVALFKGKRSVNNS
ncbi:class I SAM-dependent methyltransferase [Legionella dresdenensis]|uniref:Class I SAM-dependent methyltransferase n=1 Tax=Legionella dresdenensis TaxID=450200 RepID=A0ABV8CBG3_9GAMM